MHIADEVVVRAERVGDRAAVNRILTDAFHDAGAAERVERRRAADAFIPELSLVGEVSDQVVAYALLTPVRMNGVDPVLALDPVAVCPEHQKAGIGNAIVKWAIRFAQTHHAAGIVVTGAGSYFKRFGFLPAAESGLTPGFDVEGGSYLALPFEKLNPVAR